jgi:NADPH-dependent 2,4-dienoyl-CoA reductase/sulfur reductase-like enzyme
VVEAGCIIAGLGLELNLSLAKSAGIKIGKGILVDENLMTDHPNIYAAGDVAEFFNPALGKLMRVEHEDNANSMGGMAGRNMAGSSEAYTHLPYFYSDVFDLGYEAVGELDSSLTYVEDWSEPFRKGIIYYFREERICGVLLWNVWNKIPEARELIAQGGPFRAEEMKMKKTPEWKIQY